MYQKITESSFETLHFGHALYKISSKTVHFGVLSERGKTIDFTTVNNCMKKSWKESLTIVPLKEGKQLLQSHVSTGNTNKTGKSSCVGVITKCKTPPGKFLTILDITSPGYPQLGNGGRPKSCGRKCSMVASTCSHNTPSSYS
jgi:hypothetical protein